MKITSVLAMVSSLVLASAAAAQTTAPATNPPSVKVAPPAKLYKVDSAPYAMKAGQWRSSKLVGVDVYNASNESIGEMEEVILSASGGIEAVVIGVGGFLGMGEHDIALKFDQVKFVDEPRSAQTAVATKPVAGAPAGTTTATGAPPVNPSSTADTSPRSGSAKSMAYRGYPDHAVVSLTKEQLKAMPEVRWES